MRDNNILINNRTLTYLVRIISDENRNTISEIVTIGVIMNIAGKASKPPFARAENEIVAKNKKPMSLFMFNKNQLYFTSQPRFSNTL